MGMQHSVSQAEHPKLAEGFEVLASSAQTALPPGGVPRPSLSLLGSHSWRWLLTLEAVTRSPSQHRKWWGTLQTPSVKAAPAQGALGRNTHRLKAVWKSWQLLMGWRGAHRSHEATQELHVPAVVRETPEEMWVSPVLCALQMRCMQIVQGICHPQRV